MNISIDKNLRDLRGKRGNTQEDLAEHLGLSPQAISRWERGETMPDITLLPAIAAFYDVTVDELLGVGEIRKREKVDEYLNISKKLLNEGRIAENVEHCKKACLEFPNDMYCLEQYMRAMHICHNPEYTDEIIRIGEKIMMEAKEPHIRIRTVQILCLSHMRRGDYDEAMKYADSSSSVYASRERLQEIVMKNCGKDTAAEKRGLVNIVCYIELIGSTVNTICAVNKNDTERCIRLRETMLKLHSLVFDDGFDGHFSIRAINQHKELAALYSQNENEDRVREHLEGAVDCAQRFDTLPEEYTYHSTLLYGYEGSSKGARNHQQTEAENLLHEINHSNFDRYRDRDWFIAIEERLKSQNDTNG